jgi:hypothetical protein
VSGQARPCYRFLQALRQSASPEQARRFVVATGDAISFNTVYRDRRVLWPIQDLPFSLVFFCHQSPIDPDAGFQPPKGHPAGERESEGTKEETGTDDLLLLSEIVESVVLACAKEAGGLPGPDGLARRLVAAPLREPGAGPTERLFQATGRRWSGTGEHVVYLRPEIEGDRVKPEAVIEVWAWRRTAGGQRVWQRVGRPLRASHDESLSPSGGPHGN